MRRPGKQYPRWPPAPAPASPGPHPAAPGRCAAAAPPRSRRGRYPDADPAPPSRRRRAYPPRPFPRHGGSARSAPPDARRFPSRLRRRRGPAAPRARDAARPRHAGQTPPPSRHPIPSRAGSWAGLRKCRPFAQPVQVKRRSRQRTQRQGNQQQFVVIARDAVHADESAALAAVQDGPLAIGPRMDGHRLHRPAAGGTAVAGLQSTCRLHRQCGQWFRWPSPARRREWRVAMRTQKCRTGKTGVRRKLVMGIKLQQNRGKQETNAPDRIPKRIGRCLREPGPRLESVATRLDGPAFRRGAFANSNWNGLHASFCPVITRRCRILYAFPRPRQPRAPLWGQPLNLEFSA